MLHSMHSTQFFSSESQKIIKKIRLTFLKTDYSASDRKISGADRNVRCPPRPSLTKRSWKSKLPILCFCLNQVGIREMQILPICRLDLRPQETRHRNSWLKAFEKTIPTIPSHFLLPKRMLPLAQFERNWPCLLLRLGSGSGQDI